MYRLVLVNSKQVILKAGLSLGFLLIPFVCSCIVFQIPCAVGFRLLIIVALWLMFLAILSQVVSQITYNGNRLVVVTPFGLHVHPINSIRHVSYRYSKLNMHFSFTLKFVAARRKTYHFHVCESNGVPFYKIGDDLCEILENVMNKIGQVPPPRKKANRHYDM